VAVDCASDDVTIADAGLEAAVRAALALPAGPIGGAAMAAVSGTLAFQTKGIVNLEGIQCFSGLSLLDLTGNQIVDLAPLAELVQLAELHLDSNEISNVTPLASMTGLEFLRLRSNRIVDIMPLTTLAGTLQGLDLGDNQVTDFSPLAGWDTGSNGYLYLDGNQASGIGALAGIQGIGQLDLSGNQITDLSPLGSLDNVGSLDLSDNLIADLSPLNPILSVETLDLSNNQIVDLIPLSEFAGLRSVYLASNQIADLGPLTVYGGLGLVTTLDLRSNAVTDLSPLVAESDYDSGRLLLDDNPLCNPLQSANIDALEARSVDVVLTTCP
jgi:internalin A